MDQRRIFFACLLGLFIVILLLMGWNFIYDAQTKFLSGTAPSILAPEPLTRPRLPPVRQTDPVTGSNDSKAISITIFSDFQCAFCRLSEIEMIRAITDLKQPVRVIWRDLPLSTVARETMLNALAGRCAHAQKKFWDLHDALLTVKTVNEYSVKEKASTIGLDIQTFNICLEQGTYLTEIQKDVALAREYRITNAPTFFIGNEPAITGYVSSQEFKRLLERAGGEK